MLGPKPRRRAIVKAAQCSRKGWGKMDGGNAMRVRADDSARQGKSGLSGAVRLQVQAIQPGKESPGCQALGACKCRRLSPARRRPGCQALCACKCRRLSRTKITTKQRERDKQGGSIFVSVRMEPG